MSACRYKSRGARRHFKPTVRTLKWTGDWISSLTFIHVQTLIQPRRMWDEYMFLPQDHIQYPSMSMQAGHLLSKAQKRTHYICPFLSWLWKLTYVDCKMLLMISSKTLPLKTVRQTGGSIWWHQITGSTSQQYSYSCMVCVSITQFSTQLLSSSIWTPFLVGWKHGGRWGVGCWIDHTLTL